MPGSRVWRRGAQAGLLAFLHASLAFANADRPATTWPVEIRLPPEIVYEQVVGPDSAVVFRHETHVALAGRKCTVCHPRPFPMLTPVRRASHATMNKGQGCGSCHDGRQGFGVSDSKSCLTCHAGRTPPQTTLAAAAAPAGPRVPKPITYRRSDSSPGQVAFRHQTHTVKTTCAGCHPKPFGMKASGARPDGAMHEATACGACHDGVKAFGVEDARACVRCHTEGKGSP